jgi:hypothetical protein
MSDKIKKQYNVSLERAEVKELNGQFVVIDSKGKVYSKWPDRHHAVEHQSLVNSLIAGEKNAIKRRKK